MKLTVISHHLLLLLPHGLVRNPKLGVELGVRLHVLDQLPPQGPSRPDSLLGQPVQHCKTVLTTYTYSSSTAAAICCSFSVWSFSARLTSRQLSLVAIWPSTAVTTRLSQYPATSCSLCRRAMLWAIDRFTDGFTCRATAKNQIRTLQPLQTNSYLGSLFPPP